MASSDSVWGSKVPSSIVRGGIGPGLAYPLKNGSVIADFVGSDIANGSNGMQEDNVRITRLR
jgi:hypothetical protein